MRNSGNRKMSKKPKNTRPNPYAIFLDPLEADDLGETRDDRLIVRDIEPYKRISRLLGLQPSCSIGIAGPRGSGKTTLLYSFPSSPVPIGNSPRQLSVVVSAPVAYDAREFILHLFSTVCKKVLDLNVQEAPTLGWPEIELASRQTLNSILRPISWLSAILGTALVVFHFIGRFLGALDDQEPTILMLGLTLGVIGYMLIFWQRVSWYRYRKRRKKEATDAPNPPLPPRPKDLDYNLKYVDPDDLGYMKYADQLAQAAKWWIKDIRFQQSYSAGWAGSLKLPIGLEAGASGSVSLSNKQLSLPQIVDQFKEFVNRASIAYQVVIGIDELDKMESEDKAQQFLNQIKGILPCQAFYMVSVSEGAMSQFEHRGRPFRDVFDSCFGHIIGVDYLSFEKAMDVIGSRVKGGAMPIPFVALCYCLSGGLARDLMRAIRSLLVLRRADTKHNDILTLASRSIELELDARLRSIMFEAKNKMAAGIGVETFMKKIHELRLVATSSKDLLNAAGDLSREASKAPEDIQPLYSELVAYFYYYAILMETFSRRRSSSSWRRDGKRRITKWANSLAVARQSLTESCDITISLLRDYQRNYLS